MSVPNCPLAAGSKSTAFMNAWWNSATVVLMRLLVTGSLNCMVTAATATEALANALWRAPRTSRRRRSFPTA